MHLGIIVQDSSCSYQAQCEIVSLRFANTHTYMSPDKPFKKFPWNSNKLP